MRILVLDTETTGVDTEVDRVVQISMVLVDGPVRRVVMNTLCNPMTNIPRAATDIHGITDFAVTNMPDSWLACWLAVHNAKLVQPDLLVTYNGRLFDLPLIARLSGISDLDRLPHIDVLDMAYRYLPALPNHKLSTLYRHLMKKEADQAHDAAADVLYTYEIMEALRKQLQMSIEELVTDMSQPRPYHLMPISKHKGKLLRDVPAGFAKWLLGQNEGKPMRADLRLSMEAILNGTA